MNTFLRIPLGTYVSDSGGFILNAKFRQNVVSIVDNLARKRVGTNPDGSSQQQSDLQPLMDAAEKNQVPYMGWYFQEDSCHPGMLATQTLSTVNTKVCLSYTTSAWGALLKKQLAKPSP